MLESMQSMVESIQSTLVFKGTISTEEDLQQIKDMRPGDVYMLDPDSSLSCLYTYTGEGKWYPLSCEDDMQDRTKKDVKTQCPKCGASLPITQLAIDTGVVRCEWCRSLVKSFEWVN